MDKMEMADLRINRGRDTLLCVISLVDFINCDLHSFSIFFYKFPTVCGFYRLDLIRNRWKEPMEMS